MTFDLHVITGNWAQIQDGMFLTIVLWLCGCTLAMLTGFFAATLYHYLGETTRKLIRLYVVVFRGTPFLVQLFLLYYGGPSVGIVLSPLAAGLVGITLYAGAQFTELFRAGYESIPRGQVEAAEIFGLPNRSIVWHVQLPQMILIILPSLINLYLDTMKDTALLSVISIPEVTAILSGIGSSTYAFAETLFALGAFYWLMLEIVTFLGRSIERRASRYTTH
ncbi:MULTISPECIES: amino acid ABC transporter permease [Paraburkholderia]|uniref:Polar amino acid transport system permease protein n=2 Tax=Paraburkholderia TaxID=1822464 RepID=A0A7Z0AZY8_9BURK|nr:amino acid ABC transporter permease [Paraburkholderia bryophila]NYH15020.1 polar amino acid transport system permease protein [Paraburkholderia bryophila]NYH26648.1 polar amino acid transport system permease protein [Paraburkholderia bryophila]